MEQNYDRIMERAAHEREKNLKRIRPHVGRFHKMELLVVEEIAMRKVRNVKRDSSKGISCNISAI